MTFGWTITPVGEFNRQGKLVSSNREGLSSIVYLGDDLYYVMNDKYGILSKVKIDIDRTTGRIKNAEKISETVFKCGKDADHEGMVWDRHRNLIWVTEEKSNDIRAYDPATGAHIEDVEMPDVYNGFCFNQSLESLTISANGLEMWTCNESALNGPYAKKDKRRFRGKPFNETVDGMPATREKGTIVRLQKFTRRTKSSKWKAAEQFAYVTDPISSLYDMEWLTCGVSELLLLPDGTLLALERKVQTTAIGIPTVCCEIYQIDFKGATETSKIRSLSKTPFTPVSKKLLFKKNTLLAVYEGMCLGPELKDGSRAMILISDADQGAAAKIFSLKLK